MTEMLYTAGYPLINDLPVEVLIQVVESLGLNKRALAACTLVSRSWLELSRPLFFSTLNVYLNNISLLHLAEVFQNNPGLARFVKRLSVMSSNPNTSEWQPFPSFLDLSRLLQLLSHLPSLDCLCLSDMFLQDDVPRVDGIASPFRLKELQLHSVLFGNNGDVEYPLTLFPLSRLLFLFKTDRLVCGHWFGLAISGHDYIIAPDPVILDSLTLKAQGKMPGISALRSVILWEDLRSLDVTIWSSEDMPMVTSLLQDAAQNTTELNLDLHRFFYSRMLEDELNIPPWHDLRRVMDGFKTLETLRIEVDPSPKVVRLDITPDFITRRQLFPTLTPHSLRKLVITFLIPRAKFSVLDPALATAEFGVVPPQLYGLSGLDTHLTRDRYPRLERVVVEIEAFRRDEAEIVHSAVEEALPKLRSRKLLEVIRYTTDIS